MGIEVWHGYARGERASAANPPCFNLPGADQPIRLAEGRRWLTVERRPSAGTLGITILLDTPQMIDDEFCRRSVGRLGLRGERR